MNSKLLFSALLSLMIAFSACNKSDNEDELPVSIPKIKTITHHLGSVINSENYEYDELGRLIKLTYAPGYYTQYEYRADTIITYHLGVDLSFSDTLILNKQGLVVAEKYMKATHEYTPDGKLDKSTYYVSTGEIIRSFDYKVSNGNTTSCDLWERNGANLTIKNTYDYKFLANSSNTIGYENRGISFFGKQDKNLVSGYTTTHEEVTYIYEWDAQNRVVKVRKDYNTENVYDTYTYYD